MNRKRYAFAMTVVMAAALCADRVAVAAPQARVGASESVATRVMNRLSQSFRRVVTAVRVVELRREGVAVQLQTARPETVVVDQKPISPFQFRLPPPSVA